MIIVRAASHRAVPWKNGGGVTREILRVPPELLMAEDVASVYLVKDTSMIKTEALQKAIADAVNAVAKRALPDSVYVTA